MGVPALPLTELYNAAGRYIQERGGEVRFRCSIDQFHADESQALLCSGGNEHAFDYIVVAVPFQTVASLLPDDAEAEPLRKLLGNFESSPITGIHLWFDREITGLDHAVLLDRTIQWMFHKSRILQTEPTASAADLKASTRNSQPATRNSQPATRNSYVELVVSSSKSLVDKPRAEIIELALRELAEFFPAVREAKLVKSTVIKEVHATYSPAPGIDACRPKSATPWLRVFLAGDWIATGWPATMEGAVRSGYLAAQSLAHAAGITEASYLVPDLPAAGLMRLFK
jgi:zeta-carotene desaturase